MTFSEHAPFRDQESVALQRRFAGQVHASLSVDFNELNNNFITHVYHVFHFFHPFLGELRNVDQAFRPGMNSTKAPKFIRRVTLPV